MKTNLDYRKILKKATLYAARYRVMITIAVIIAIFSFAILRINQLSDPTANEDTLTELTAKIKKVSIDDEVVENIRNLIESNVKISPQYSNRNNPFSDQSN